MVNATKENLKEDVSKSKKLEKWIVKNIFNKTVNLISSNKEKEHTGLWLLHLTFEHSISIFNLIEKGHYGSTLALFRPLEEALHRGEWLSDYTTDEEFTKLEKTSDFPFKNKVSGYLHHRPESKELCIISLLFRY